MSRSRSGPQALGEYGSKPEVSPPRRFPGECSGYQPHASPSRPGTRHGSALLLLRLETLHRTGLGHGLNRLWLSAPRRGFFLPAGEFIDAPTIHVRVEHFEGSAAGVDLIVMREIGEAFENAEQLLVPCRAPDLHIAGATLRAEWSEPRQLVAALGCRPHREAAQRPHQMLRLALAG